MSGRTAWGVAIIAGAVFAVSLPATHLSAPMAAEVVAPAQKPALAKAEQPVSPPPAPVSAESARTAATETPVEMERRFNNLRREFLDLEIEAVHRWLTALAILLAVMGILATIVGIFGFRRFQEIERDAQAVLRDIRRHEREARERVDRFDFTAEGAAKNETVVEEARAATEDPGASLADIAVADALTLQRSGRTKEAIAKWEAIANLVENTDRNQAARAHHSVGYLYSTSRAEIESGSTDEDILKRAVQAFNEAIRLQPDLVTAYYNRGNSKAELDRHADAIADYDEAIRLQPDLASAYYSRGLSKAKLEQYSDAIADFDEAIRLQPDLADSYHNRGGSKIKLEDYKGAIADFDEAIRLRPDLAGAYHNRGISKSGLGLRRGNHLETSASIRMRRGKAAARNVGRA